MSQNKVGFEVGELICVWTRVCPKCGEAWNVTSNKANAKFALQCMAETMGYLAHQQAHREEVNGNTV